jgi:hypothetical protein
MNDNEADAASRPGTELSDVRFSHAKSKAVNSLSYSAEPSDMFQRLDEEDEDTIQAPLEFRVAKPIRLVHDPVIIATGSDKCR